MTRMTRMARRFIKLMRMCLLPRTAGVGHQDGRYSTFCSTIAMDAASGRGGLFLVVNCSQN